VLDLEVNYFGIFTENNENRHLFFCEFTKDNIWLKECIQTSNNRIKLHIVRVPINKLGNLLIVNDLM